MVKICPKHMVDGLKIMDTPHVEILPDTTRSSCYFCNGKAKYILFLPYMKHRHSCKEDEQIRKRKSGPKKGREEENPCMADSKS
ncbi:hypothetical protein [Thermoactinomyces mirandus]|uniref:Uncharacterized protein n=1 Tax=Thermoactinomyces mirandus TaxID=2756294 RepID=A0A7W2AQC8_9BACL|nr:hypothetical protein [Thermoactinomyces mirandus]MBA4601388.1 hypothetical protein [Thermoactinomyces mirandus]